MAYAIEFDARQKVQLARALGDLDDEAARTFYRAAQRRARTLQPAILIVDFSGVQKFTVTSNAVYELAQSEPIMPNPSKPIYIVAPAALVYGVSRMFQLAGEEKRPTLQVVKTLEEAYEMAGLSGLRLERVE